MSPVCLSISLVAFIFKTIRNSELQIRGVMWWAADLSQIFCQYIVTNKELSRIVGYLMIFPLFLKGYVLNLPLTLSNLFFIFYMYRLQINFNYIIMIFFRDMCATEDTEIQTSILKIRDETPNKKKCCG